MMECQLRKQIEELVLQDMEDYGKPTIEPTYSIYLIANGADEGMWQCYSLDAACEVYLLAEKIAQMWMYDSGYRPEEGDGAFFLNTFRGDIVAEYRLR